ncbi:MAG: hypothetical protein GXP38_09585 [Chloroflexi bacterium]|nr:hypothetical protein [Chloroflexota bacterium]
MSHSTRWLTLALILLVLVALVWSLGTERGRAVLPASCRARFPLSLLDAKTAQPSDISATSSLANVSQGDIPIFVNGNLTAVITQQELDDLTPVMLSGQGTTIEGWLLAEVLKHSLPATSLSAQTQVTVGSSSTNRAAQFSWAELQSPDNNIILALTATNSWLLAFPLADDQSEDAWVQEVDRIKITVAG